MRYVLLVFLLPLFCCICDKQPIVNDVTKLNPIPVSKIVVPKTSQDISNAVKQTKGPVAIGGGRFSMGGQIATEGALHLDMRGFNKVIDLNVPNKQITVQAGIRWRDIQEAVDKHDLSLKIMQSYANFTVGGSLSVNCHGRYVGEGPVIQSVESIRVVLADGKEVEASRSKNQEIFKAAIGGYGAIGVITEATLNLVPNEKIRRDVVYLPVGKYKNYFDKNIRGNKKAVFHNGDIYPPDYDNVALATFYKTKGELTIKERMVLKNKKYWLEPNVISTVSTIPFGMEIREKLLDPLVKSQNRVVWRNYEASFDVAQLEPSTPRLLFTYVLQEYFVPTEKFDEFVPKMRKVFQEHDVNVLNVSIRHTRADKESYLSWAPSEVFSFVVYYKQQTSEEAKKKVAVWTRKMIDEVLSVGGRHYLPYQIHATQDQFERAYPRHKEFFAVKKKVDPTNKFRNKLWDKYLGQ